FQTRRSAAPASSSAHTAARALPPAPSTTAVFPAGVNGNALTSAGASVLSALISPLCSKTRVLAAPIARARGVRGAAGAGARRLLGRQRHVGAANPRLRERRDGLGEQLGRDREQLVAPVREPNRRQRGVLHRRRAAVRNRPAEHTEASASSAPDHQ